jgi:glutamate--cysteine ligase
MVDMTTTADLCSTRRDKAGAVLAHSDAAARRVGEECLRDGPVGRVGLEIEAHCFDIADPMRRPGWDELTDVIAEVPPLPGGSAITVEPGGAVELSGAPADGTWQAITAMQEDRAQLREAFAGHGLGLVLLGADPLRPAERVNPGDRYRAMEQFFAASGTVDAGAAMMTSTASVQVNLDAGPREGWADRVRLAHALGPTMIAISANSPMLGAEFSGWCSSRQRVWSQLDSARCGPVLGASGGDPADEWARYALKAPVMLVQGSETVPMTEVVPFADWADGRALLSGRRPTGADLDYHLTTLFPPVRPRPTSPRRPRNRSPPSGIVLPGSVWATGGCRPLPCAACRPRRNGRRRNCTTRCRGWCIRCSRAGVRPTTSPTSWSAVESGRP